MLEEVRESVIRDPIFGLFPDPGRSGCLRRSKQDEELRLIESVAKLAKRTSSFMRLVTILLVVSMLFTALLCIRIAYIIRF